MGLHWDWDDKMGEVVYENGVTTQIYQGNAFMICTLEQGDKYQLCWYCLDKERFKNMLGNGKDKNKGWKSNMFDNLGLLSTNGEKIPATLLRLNTAYKNVPIIVSELAKAHTNIKIELYNDEV